MTLQIEKTFDEHGGSNIDVLMILRDLATRQMWGTLFWHLINKVEMSGFMGLLHFGNVIIFSTNNLFIHFFPFDEFEYETRDYLNCSKAITTLGFYPVVSREKDAEGLPDLLIVFGSAAGFSGVVLPMSAGDRVVEIAAWGEGGFAPAPPLSDNFVEDERYIHFPLRNLFKTALPATLTRHPQIELIFPDEPA